MIDMNQALFSLYPQVVTIRQNVAYDANDNVVEYDLDAVKAKAEQNAQSQADARQAALNKLMALGLTEEEALALGVK